MELENATFYGILDTGYVEPSKMIEKCTALIEGGAGIIQLRAKKESHEERQALLEKILPLFGEKAPPLIINDDWELALKYPGLGLHIGQDDLSPLEARERLGPDRILGLSTHSPTQAEGAIALKETLDYFAVGPVFATQTKPDYIPVGLELVKYVSQQSPPLPWFCIGGIHHDNARQVKQHGAQRIVVVSAVLCAEDTAASVRTLRNIMREE